MACGIGDPGDQSPWSLESWSKGTVMLWGRLGCCCLSLGTGGTYHHCHPHPRHHPCTSFSFSFLSPAFH